MFNFFFFISLFVFIHRFKNYIEISKWRILLLCLSISHVRKTDKTFLWIFWTLQFNKNSIYLYFILEKKENRLKRCRNVLSTWQQYCLRVLLNPHIFFCGRCRWKISSDGLSKYLPERNLLSTEAIASWKYARFWKLVKILSQWWGKTTRGRR